LKLKIYFFLIGLERNNNYFQINASCQRHNVFNSLLRFIFLLFLLNRKIFSKVVAATPTKVTAAIFFWHFKVAANEIEKSLLKTVFLVKNSP
jgi:hypothetical protein